MMMMIMLVVLVVLVGLWCVQLLSLSLSLGRREGGIRGNFAHTCVHTYVSLHGMCALGDTLHAHLFIKYLIW